VAAVTMADSYTQLKTRLAAEPHTWLITGVTGFIGSNLLETLLKLNQRVVGLDNFATGHQRNLNEVQTCLSGCFPSVNLRLFPHCARQFSVPDVAPGLHAAFPG